MRWRLARGPRTLMLEQVRRRLELLLVAMYDTPNARRNRVATSTAGDIGLPPQLDASAGLDDAIARYRLLALAQAARLARRDTKVRPRDDVLARDLYRLAESAAAERELVGARAVARARRSRCCASPSWRADGRRRGSRTRSDGSRRCWPRCSRHHPIRSRRGFRRAPHRASRVRGRWRWPTRSAASRAGARLSSAQSDVALGARLVALRRADRRALGAGGGGGSRLIPRRSRARGATTRRVGARGRRSG